MAKAEVKRAPAKRSNAKRVEGSPVIWGVGGGKGGVGKSVITSNLGVALARRGRRTVVMDADLGAANVHTLLGVDRPRRTLSDFLNREVSHLEDVLSETPEPNLRLISGSRALIGMANPRHAQKQKLLRQLRTLDVDHVVLDLSAGSAFNVLDFFLEARHPILVVVPEPTSIENAYHFLKSAFFRSMSVAAKQSPVKAAITRVLEAKSRQRIRSPRELIDAVSELDPSAGEALRQRSKEFRPLLVVNQSRTAQHRKLGAEIRDACANYLGTDIEYLGTLERDESVRVAVGQRRPVLDLFPSCAFSMDLEALAVRLLSRTDGALSRGVPMPSEDLLELDDGSNSPTALAGSSASPASPASATSAGSTPAVRTPEAELRPLDLSQPGASLRGRREQLHLDLSEIYRRTRIRHLEHIESERFDRLPPEVYVRGYVVQYARALGIREAEALASSFVERYRQARAGL